MSFTTSYAAVGEIFVGRVNFKHPATGELTDVSNPHMAIVVQDDPRGLDVERVVFPRTPMMRIREGVYTLGIRIDAQFEQFKTYFVNFDAAIVDPADNSILFKVYEEERLRIADFRTSVPHFHVSPTEIVLLSYYYTPGTCGCWVLPSGPFFVNGGDGSSGACDGEQFQFPDGNTNLGCCNDHGLNFSLE